MTTKLKEKIREEIEKIPEESIPSFYRIFQALKKEFARKTKTGNRGSLRGIWGMNRIDEPLFEEAKRSLFPYETK